jgi:hypothetical protein
MRMVRIACQSGAQGVSRELCGIALDWYDKLFAALVDGSLKVDEISDTATTPAVTNVTVDYQQKSHPPKMDRSRSLPCGRLFLFV